MAEEDLAYKDISELKKELEGMKGRKDISAKELYDAVHGLSQTISDMLEVFGAAAEQMRLEEKGYEAEAKKHEVIMSKLDKVIDQNKTIAEGMVAIVEMVKEKIVAPAKEREEAFRPRAEPMGLSEPKPFMRPQWQPKPEQMMPRQAMQQPMPPPSFSPQSMTPQMPPDFGMQLPPLEPTPSPEFDLEEPSLPEEGPKKKGLFSRFKK